MAMENPVNTSNPPIALVVDDEPLIRMDTADMVAEEGFEVIEARTADEALAILGKHPSLKLVLTDIQMPGETDGLDLARHICEHRPDVCVIVSSGAIRPHPGQLPESARFIGKPISHGVVRRTIREICPPGA